MDLLSPIVRLAHLNWNGSEFLKGRRSFSPTLQPSSIPFSDNMWTLVTEKMTFHPRWVTAKIQNILEPSSGTKRTFLVMASFIKPFTLGQTLAFPQPPFFPLRRRSVRNTLGRLNSLVDLSSGHRTATKGDVESKDSGLLPSYRQLSYKLAHRKRRHNAFKDVSHIVKFNGENYSDYRCEFLSMMEQLGMKTIVDAPEGKVEILPTEVIIVYS